MEYQVVGSEQTELGRFRIHKDQVAVAGAVYPYSFVETKPSISVFPFVGDQILLIHQYRHSVKKWLWEIPGGGLEEGEDIRQAAERELLEEAGYKTREYHDLGSYYPSAGISTEIAYLCAVECELERHEPKREPLEKMHAKLVDIDEFCEMVRTGEFAHGMGLAAWARLITGKGQEYADSIFKTGF